MTIVALTFATVGVVLLAILLVLAYLGRLRAADIVGWLLIGWVAAGVVVILIPAWITVLTR
jgi:hypothetical protein